MKLIGKQAPIPKSSCYSTNKTVVATGRRNVLEFVNVFYNNC
jgi:hypothetical protein